VRKKSKNVGYCASGIEYRINPFPAGPKPTVGVRADCCCETNFTLYQKISIWGERKLNGETLLTVI
jgi:hypothetical protein